MLFFRMAEPVKSVGRALELVEQLAATNGEASLTELACATGLAPPTAHRLLRTLVELQWVVQDSSSSHYRLSYKLLTIAGGIEARTSVLRALARPHLVSLRDLSGESTNLVVLDGLAAVYLDQVPSTRSMRMFAEIGARVPAYASAAGKAMLACLPAATLPALAHAALVPLTNRTLSDHDALEADLVRTRRRGYAFDDGEYEIGVSCIAAPITAGAGQPAAAISVSAPTARFRTLDRALLGRQLVEHTQQVSHQLVDKATLLQ